jgi:hypothetical protein
MNFLSGKREGETKKGASGRVSMFKVKINLGEIEK